MRLREKIDVLLIKCEYLKAIMRDNISDVKERVSFAVENYKGNVKFTEVYPGDNRLYMDIIAFERQSIIIFQEFTDFILEENRQGLLVYLQKKYSKDFSFENIGLDDNTELYASKQADNIASQMIQEYIDKYDGHNGETKARAEFYYEKGLLDESAYKKIQEELLVILYC